MEPIYCIQLTRAEYEYLLRIAPEGIQAAMEATLRLEYPDLGNPWEDRHRLDYPDLASDAPQPIS